MEVEIWEGFNITTVAALSFHGFGASLDIPFCLVISLYGR